LVTGPQSRARSGPEKKLKILGHEVSATYDDSTNTYLSEKIPSLAIPINSTDFTHCKHKVSSKEAATLGSPHSRIASFAATLDRVIATIWLTDIDVEVKNKPKATVLLYSQILIPALSSHRTPKVATAQSGMRLSHYLKKLQNATV
jgi:hypothetical protein